MKLMRWLNDAEHDFTSGISRPKNASVFGDPSNAVVTTASEVKSRSKNALITPRSLAASWGPRQKKEIRFGGFLPRNYTKVKARALSVALALLSNDLRFYGLRYLGENQ